jgi:predicted flap endonuclease-1-like 5' DNA nuclease
MTMDRSARTALAAAFLVIAVLLFANLAITQAPVLDYWLPLLLLILAAGFAVLNIERRPAPAVVEAPTALTFYPPAPALNSETASLIDASASSAAAEPTAPSSVTAAPVPGEGQQDLLAIDGVGPKAQAALYAAGINTFQQLSETNVEQLRQIMSAAKVRVVGDSIETWARQAKYVVDRDYPGMMRYIAAYKKKPEVRTDDLLIIDGIGPKAQEALYAGGIHTFDQLSQLKVEQIEEILHKAGVTIVGQPTTWAAQAKFAAEEDYPGMMRYIAEHKRKQGE